MFYFDHCASTPPHEEVIRTLTEVMAKHYANPSSLHRGGMEARHLLERSRGAIAGLFGTQAKDWIFTSGGTESNNLALLGAARANVHKGKHIITTAIEHPSVYEACLQLQQEGFKLSFLPVSRSGAVSIADVEAQLTAETTLVSIMHVNNEVGSIQPVGEIGRMLKKRQRPVLFHVDGVQSVGKLPIDLIGSGIDLFSASAHKIRGPRGVGLLYRRNGIKLAALMAGGGQEFGLRSGTENVAAIVASAKAFRLAMESQPERYQRMRALRARLVAGIAQIPELVLNGGEADEMAPHIVSFSYPGMKPEVLIHLLEKHRVAASTKSACSSKDNRPSRVLEAMGVGQARASSGIRVSFGDEHGNAELEWLCSMLQKTVDKLKPLERKDIRS
ncbi:cysteine desulfurase family protein [Paenibacillus nasutitermitis]|uniref:Aminotransferase V n=1 Tax=Paenibacillus nasutitermitis TaxID=1652958 RepID=A0A917DVN4_9BACL|nr:cysteine desulfurase family protein [Paenibacillus nasutitermitis]GGD71247.1 aminotransferase V [Paenibacillus nasutitermitis]